MTQTFSDDELLILRNKLEKHIEEQNKNWNSFVYAKTQKFYQGFKKIGITGARPTEERFDYYDIKNYFSKEKTVLDIGSNCGFFSLYVSEFVNSIVGVEINPYLVNISNDVKNFLSIKNADFYNKSFESFNVDQKFDIVFSFANDSTIDGNTRFCFEEYIDKIQNYLSPNGIVIFESQAEDYLLYEKQFVPKLKILEKKFTILENRKVPSEYPLSVPERFFLVLKSLQ